MKKQDGIGFTNVDDTTNPNYFVSYLDAISTLHSIQVYKQKTYSRLEIKEGDRILDVGCGIGNDVRQLAQKVGNRGHVVGVDNSETMIAEARKRSESLKPLVEYHVCDVHSLEFPERIFDGCRADRTFQHLKNPQKALAEIVRVVRSGGRVVISEPDWETLIIDASDRTLTRKILNFHCDSSCNGWIGRKLPALFNEIGLKNIGVDANTLMLSDCTLADKHLGILSAAIRAQQAGIISITEACDWTSHLEQKSQAGHFFCAITGFSIFGCKP
ncbi:MAG: class I SAM-dependent methyltransferase [Scytonema sp. PMC 1069.18]|nr:class I SAM-dependent methyltransferase [Scytonema sp. PMC 1069.18]MEC4881439.1 class I SAM-dependent methyltransferase [Scytonema sp. PMC 1070.18]